MRPKEIVHPLGTVPLSAGTSVALTDLVRTLAVGTAVAPVVPLAAGLAGAMAAPAAPVVPVAGRVTVATVPGLGTVACAGVAPGVSRSAAVAALVRGRATVAPVAALAEVFWVPAWMGAALGRDRVSAALGLASAVTLGEATAVVRGMLVPVLGELTAFVLRVPLSILGGAAMTVTFDDPISRLARVAVFAVAIPLSVLWTAVAAVPVSPVLILCTAATSVLSSVVIFQAAVTFVS